MTPTGDTFAQLEVGDGLLGSGHDRLLSGDSGQFLDRLFDVLFVGAEFAKTHVEDDLDELGAFHDGGVVELLHEFRNDLFLVKGLESGDDLGLLGAFRMVLSDGDSVLLFFSHVLSPYLRMVPLALA